MAAAANEAQRINITAHFYQPSFDDAAYFLFCNLFDGGSTKKRYFYFMLSLLVLLALFVFDIFFTFFSFVIDE